MNCRFLLTLCFSLLISGSISIGINIAEGSQVADAPRATEGGSAEQEPDSKEPVPENNAVFVWSIVLGCVAGGLSIVGLVIWIIYRSEKQRTEDLAKVADDLGMQFSSKRDNTLLAKLQGFSLFNRGHTRKMKNLMTAETDLAKLTIFDYNFTTGGGNSAHTHRHTLIAMESDSLQIPQFSIRPEGFWDKIGAKIGFQDIDFNEHPAFSESFVVQGTDEAAVRRFFDAEIVDMLERRKEVAIDAIPGLFIYRTMSRKRPEEIRELMEESYALYQAFYKRQG